MIENRFTKRENSMKTRMLTAFLALFAMAPSLTNATEITLHGSTTVTANLLDQHSADIEKATGHTLKIIANGSSNGIKGAASGAADIGMISAPLENVIAKVNKKAPGTVEEGSLIAHQVAEARVAFTVHPSNTVTELTLQQIADILNGTITNWKEIGGQDKPIMVIAEVSGGGLRTMVEAELLNKKSISAPVKRELPNGTQIPKVTAQIPNALGVMSAALVDEKLKEVKTDSPIAQPLIFVTKGSPSEAVQSVIDAAKAAGGM